jgi:hypothetical protein
MKSQTIKSIIARLIGPKSLIDLPNQYAGAATHANGRLTLECDAAIALENAVVKVGTNAAHVAVTAANTDVPLGIAQSKTDAAEDHVGVQLFGKGGDTKNVVASAAILRLARVVPTAAGKVVTLPTSGGGTHYVIGRVLTAAAADGDVIELDDCTPYPVTVGA